MPVYSSVDHYRERDAVFCSDFSAVTHAGADWKLGYDRNGKFVSEKLAFSIEVPASFTVISEAEAALLTDAGAEMLKKGPASDKRIDDAIGRSIRLLAISEKPFGSPQNSALEIAAVKQQTGITAKMALTSSVMVLKGTPYTLKRSLGSIRLGAHYFAAAEFEGTFGQIKLTQRLYMIMHKGYSILFVANYFTEQQRTELEKTISTFSPTK